MSSYDGRHAELYDLFYAAKPYEEEARFVHDRLLDAARGPALRVLDLACGTGRHAVALEQLGHEVVGVDHSPSMIEVARRRAAREGVAARFEVGDLTRLDVAGAPFDAATCLFDAIGYVRTNEALQATFAGIHAAVRPDGLLVFEFWHAAAMLRAFDPVRLRRFDSPDGQVLRISETELDCERQLARVTYTVLERRADGTHASFQETQTNRYFLVQEMAHWLTSSGFEPLSFLDGFSRDGRVTEETWHVLAVARRGLRG